MNDNELAGHTPLPWKVEENVKAGGVVHLAVTARHAGDSWMPCSITPMHMCREEDRANAALIVQAVNNHEALREALHALYKEAIGHAIADNVLRRDAGLDDLPEWQSFKQVREVLKALNVGGVR